MAHQTFKDEQEYITRQIATNQAILRAYQDDETKGLNADRPYAAVAIAAHEAELQRWTNELVALNTNYYGVGITY